MKFAPLVDSYLVGNYHLEHWEYDELLDSVSRHIESEQQAKAIISEYIEALNDLWNHGGHIYRVVWLENNQLPNTNNIGIHWTHDMSVIKQIGPDLANLANATSQYSCKEYCYIITGEIPPHNVYIEDSLYIFQNNPEEQKIRTLHSTHIKVFNIKPLPELDFISND